MEIFATLFSETIRPTNLKLDTGTHMDNGPMYRVYTRNRRLLLIHPFMSLLFFRLSENVMPPKSKRNLVHRCTMNLCIVHTGMRIDPFISSFFFISNFQTLKFLRNCEVYKLGRHVANEWINVVYRNEAAAVCLFLSLSFLILSKFD